MERALLFPTPLWREIKDKPVFDIRVLNIHEGEGTVARPQSRPAPRPPRESAMQRRAECKTCRGPLQVQVSKPQGKARLGPLGVGPEGSFCLLERCTAIRGDGSPGLRVCGCEKGRRI